MPNASNLWILYALLGAVFAGVVQVMSKPAGDKLGPNPVNFIRAIVMVAFFAVVVGWSYFAPKAIDGATAAAADPAAQSARNLSMRFAIALALGSGIASSLSWFFGYRALRLSAVANSYSLDKLSLVFGVVLAVIFLGERPGLLNCGGIALMLAGAYLVTLKPA